MNLRWTLPAIILILTGTMSVMTGYNVYRRRRYGQASVAGAVLLWAGAEWMLGYALELASISPSAKIFWDKAQYLGICIVPVGWLVYTLLYTKRGQWVTRRTLVLLSIVPLATLVLAFTNDAHGLIWNTYLPDLERARLPERVTYGAGQWIYIAFANIVVLAGIWLQIQALVRSGRLYRWQASALLLAVFAPWLVSVGTIIFDLNPLSNLELTPLALGLTVPVIAWGLNRLQRRDIVPVARGTVVESMSDALIVLDPQNRVVDLNSSAQNLVGQTDSAAIGRPVRQVWPEWPEHLTYPHTETGGNHRLVLSKGDEQRIYDVRISPLTDRRQRLVSQAMVLRDITELNQRTVELSIILEAVKAVTSTLDLEEVLALIAQQMVEIIGVDGCTLSRWDQDADAVVTWIEHRRQATESAEQQGTAYRLDEYPATRAVLESGEPLAVCISDREADPAEVAHMQDTGITSLLLLPLDVRGRVLGLAELDQTQYEREFTSGEIRLCQALADQAAIAIENARLHAETRKRLQEQIALREAGLAISSALDLQSVLTHVADQMSQAVDATSAYICSYEPATKLATVIAEHIGPQARPEECGSDLGATYLEDDPVFEKILLEGGCDISHIDDPNITEAERAHMHEYGAKTVLYIPLRMKDQPIGFAELWESRQRREFTAQEISLCTDIARQAAIALENARLYEQAQQEIDERLRAEEQIKNSLTEKEVLLQEVHHRVKNNLQIISSLLSLQTDYVEDAQALEIFKVSQHRVRSMALIHEKLYRSQDLAQVDFADYVQCLTGYLIQSYSSSTGPVVLKVVGEDVLLDIDKAVPCGLIVNELVSNSLKHAFSLTLDNSPDIAREIQVKLRISHDRQVTLLVRDNGVGFPPGLDFRNTSSLGLHLVNVLVEQLSGSIALQNTQGTQFEITFAT